MERFQLGGKVAIISGASTGLGVAFAHALGSAGADVSLAARRIELLHETAQSVEAFGRRALVVQSDVTSPTDCQRVVDLTMAEFGKVDILVNNAGVGGAIAATRETPDDFRGVVDVNLMGTYWLTQSCGRVMKPGSSIINISSVLGLTTSGLPQAAYSASKAGVMGLTRDLCNQWTGRKGIRVNSIAPGYFATEMTDTLLPGYLESVVDSRVPIGRLGHLEECAAAVVFLASNASSYISGIVLPVDGGLLTT